MNGPRHTPNLKARAVGSGAAGTPALALAATQVMTLHDPDQRANAMRVDAHFAARAGGHVRHVEIIDLDTGGLIARTPVNRRVRRGDRFTIGLVVKLDGTKMSRPVRPDEMRPLERLDAEVEWVCQLA